MSAINPDALPRRAWRPEILFAASLGSITRRRGARLAMILLTLLQAACVQMGPQVLVEGRAQYNIAVQQTEAQQLLLNIVRNRYNDTILFLDITSITSGFSRGVNGGRVTRW